MLQWLQNINPQVVIVFLAFGLPAIAKAIQWLQEQRAKAQAQAERRRAAEESLRTGRPSRDAVPSAAEASASEQAAPEETFAERRRRQIEELKRREAAARQQRQQPQPSPQPTQQPNQQPTQQPSPQRPVPARRQVPGTPQPTTQPTPQPTPVLIDPSGSSSTPFPMPTRDPMGGPTMQPAPAGASPIPREQIAATLGGLTGGGRLAAASSVSPVASAPVIGAMTRRDWQRAIVLGEVLAPPRAVRGYEDPSTRG